MLNRTPTPRDKRPPVPDFTPVPRKYRHDGWTPERQKAFIEALAATGSVSHAARAVNMAKEGAYQLRLHPQAASFRAAWEAALDHGVQRLVDVTMERAIDGVPVPIVHKGEVVGERRVYNDRLAMFHMRHRLPGRYGALNPPRAGTRHPDTAAREAEEAMTDEEREAAQLDMLGQIFALYDAKVRTERQARLEGDLVEADFALRQLTHIEVLLEAGGAAQALIDRVNRDPFAQDSRDVYATRLTDMLDEIRREAWARAGEPQRPTARSTARNATGA